MMNLPATDPLRTADADGDFAGASVMNRFGGDRDASAGGATWSQLGCARSFLFVPANRPERFGKALASGGAVFRLDGQMIDALVVQLARRTLSLSRAIGPVEPA